MLKKYFHKHIHNQVSLNTTCIFKIFVLFGNQTAREFLFVLSVELLRGNYLGFNARNLNSMQILHVVYKICDEVHV